MFDAFTSDEILKDLPLQIESIATHDSTLLVGTKQGTLLVYSLEQNNKVNLLHTKKYFGKKSITQLGVLKKVDSLIVSLSDFVVSIHSYRVSPSSIELKVLLAKTRGATIFTLHEFTDNERNMAQLAVAVRKKIIFYQWSRKGEPIEIKEISLYDIPKALSFAGKAYSDCLFIGFKSKYSQLKISTGNIEELFPTGQVQTLIVSLFNLKC